MILMHFYVQLYVVEKGKFYSKNTTLLLFYLFYILAFENR